MSIRKDKIEIENENENEDLNLMFPTKKILPAALAMPYQTSFPSKVIKTQRVLMPTKTLYAAPQMPQKNKIANELTEEEKKK
jgi:hypothetical protein